MKVNIILIALYIFSSPTFVVDENTDHIKNDTTSENQQTLNIKFDDRFYNNFNPKQETNIWSEIFTILTPSIVSLIGFLFIRNNVKRQLRATQEQFNKKLQVQFIADFSSALSSLLTILKPSSEFNFSKLQKDGFISENHLLLHNKIILLLNDSIPIEKSFKQLLLSIHIDPENLSKNLEKLQNFGNEIISNKKL